MKPEQVERLKTRYPEGSRVRLVTMEDLFAPPTGTLGTVTGVDDIGSILVNWDNGSRLNVLFGIDRIVKIPLVLVNFKIA